MGKENNKINITPFLEHILGVGEVKSKEELQTLIKALRQIGDKPIFTPESIEKLDGMIKKGRHNQE